MDDLTEGPLASPGFWLHHAALTWRVELERALMDEDLTPTQFIALASVGWLERQGEPPTQQQIADLSGGDRMMTSRLIRGLEDRGLVARSPDPIDARAVRVHLTEAGRGLASRAVRKAQATDRAVFGETVEELRSSLRSIARRRDRSI
ncbi:transcriptional regulator, MarR family [Quadrisphaera granulorum]|uniref:MarR family transcriptional regulator n=1 Tax=Quadrisphaera granulorum TaxID=317664 RepID=A0A316AA10_9ACTN|nr:MarR family transcriptional regulator [Quadrisphaera granulorum]PWJ53704.1 MarR family transcriptional regulator [Quadrisphaera granulorum]SZE96748.1 transcriptional regulator, MarR family [Quadrisphaera granulorum]